MYTSRTLRLAHRLRRTAASALPLRIALVGWDGSSTDDSMLRWARDYLSSTEERSYGRFDQESKWGTETNFDVDIAERWAHAEKDVINLSEGRDFLTEREIYDIVILCWVFGPRLPGTGIGQYKVSEQHTPEAWKSRLASSGAKYIFAFGNKTEVGGEYLGQIPGYQKKTLTASTTVYEKGVR